MFNVVYSVVLGPTLEYEPECDEHGDEEAVEDDGEDDLGRDVAVLAVVASSRQQPSLSRVVNEFQYFRLRHVSRSY